MTKIIEKKECGCYTTEKPFRKSTLKISTIFRHFCSDLHYYTYLEKEDKEK